MKRLSIVLLLLCAIAPATLAESNRDLIATDGRGNLVARSGTAVVVRRIGNVAVIHYRDPQAADASPRTVTYVKVGGQWKLVSSRVATLAGK